MGFGQVLGSGGNIGGWRWGSCEGKIGGIFYVLSWGFKMGEGDKSGDEVKKLSRLEREQEKVRIAQTNIDKILAGDKKKQDKRDTRQKVLLGVMFQKMIADDIVKAETFIKYSQTMTNRDKKVVEDYWAGLEREKSED